MKGCRLFSLSELYNGLTMRSLSLGQVTKVKEVPPACKKVSYPSTPISSSVSKQSQTKEGQDNSNAPFPLLREALGEL